MLNLCGSNLIPILITILCCAGLFMYFNLRLAEIKMVVEKQNRVLTSFITNVQQDIREGGFASNDLAAPEALVAAKNFDLERENEKIVVSDDEDDDDDSSSDSDESDEEDNEEIQSIQVIDLPELNVERLVPISFEVLSFPTESLPIEVLSFGNNTESSITEIIDESLNSVGASSDATSSDATSSDATATSSVTAEQSYEQMKVDELRKIVSDKNLASKEEVKKLKKPELLVLLKK